MTTFPKDLFTNLRSGTMIEVIATDGTGHCTVVTVRPDGSRTHLRRIPKSTLHTSPVTRLGSKRKTGYLRVSGDTATTHPQANERTLPMASDPFTNAQESDETPDFTAISAARLAAMSKAELSAWVASRQAVVEAITEQIDLAKNELKARITESGTQIFDETAVIARPNRRFDPAAARKKLTPAQFEAICIKKPDSKLAKEVLGAESPTYQACMKNMGWSLTIRPATDEDFDAAAKAEELRERKELSTAFEEGGALPVH